MTGQYPFDHRLPSPGKISLLTLVNWPFPINSPAISLSMTFEVFAPEGSYLQSLSHFLLVFPNRLFQGTSTLQQHSYSAAVVETLPTLAEGVNPPVQQVGAKQMEEFFYRPSRLYTVGQVDLTSYFRVQNFSQPRQRSQVDLIFKCKPGLSSIQSDRIHPLKRSDNHRAHIAFIN